MNFITRFFAGIAGLLLVAFMTVLLMVPEAIVRMVEALVEVSFVTRIAVVLILYIGLLAVMYSRVRKQKPTRTDSLMVRAQGAESSVTVESVRNLVLKTVRNIPDVADVQADVQSLDGKAEISLSVITGNDNVNVPEKQKEINRALEQVINKQLGLQMAGRPKVNIQLGGAAPVKSYSEPVVVTPSPVVTPPPAKQEIVTPPPAPAVVVPEPVKSEPEPVKEEPRGGFFDRFGLGRDEEKSEESVSSSLSTSNDETSTVEDDELKTSRDL